MSNGKKMKPSPAVTAEVDVTTDAHAPRKLTFAENVVLTIKVLGGFGVLGAALWGISLWTSPQ